MGVQVPPAALFNLASNKMLNMFNWLVNNIETIIQLGILITGIYLSIIEHRNYKVRKEESTVKKELRLYALNKGKLNGQRNPDLLPTGTFYCINKKKFIEEKGEEFENSCLSLGLLSKYIDEKQWLVKID